jgi:hypothetical protein
MSGSFSCFPVKVNKRSETMRFSTIIATIKGRPRVPARANDGGVPPTPIHAVNCSLKGLDKQVSY